MTGNHKIIFFSSLSIVMLFFSCTAPIDINTRDSEPMLVVYGCLTNEFKTQYVRLTLSSPYFYNADNPVISDAKVRVTASNGREYLFTHDTKGFYVSQRRFAVVPGITYHLTVEVDLKKDGTTACYEAETVTLPEVPVDSITMTSLNLMGFQHYSLNLFMQEPAESENYYLFNFIINDTISNSKISDFIISDDLMLNGEYLNGISLKYFNDAAEFEERGNDWDIFLMSPGDRVRLHILNIEKGYYYFIRDCISEKYGENPFFGGPPSNIYTNLSNGATGYFTSYCIQEKEAVAPEPSNQK